MWDPAPSSTGTYFDLFTLGQQKLCYDVLVQFTTASEHLVSQTSKLYLQPPAQIKQIAASKLKRDSTKSYWRYGSPDPYHDRWHRKAYLSVRFEHGVFHMTA